MLIGAVIDVSCSVAVNWDRILQFNNLSHAEELENLSTIFEMSVRHLRRNDKRGKAPEEAIGKLEEALSMHKNLLGDHFMTALCLKDLADFYFFTEKTDEGLEKALNYYEKAMEVCDSEIEGDHSWKVKVKTELALLYHEIARSKETDGDNKEELLSKMEELMKEGLDMWYRLNNNKKSIKFLGSKNRIMKVLDMYPQRFERESYYPDEPLTVATVTKGSLQHFIFKLTFMQVRPRNSDFKHFIF